MADECVIRLDGIEKSYGIGDARTLVLHGVSLAVQRGELVALIGQSGSGKSTLLNIIGGLDRADAGHIEVLGRDYAAASERELAELRNRDIGFVFQFFNLLDHLTCLGNVALPDMFSARGKRLGKLARDRAMDALRRVGMVDLAQRKPPELSGGQKQRVAIARAMFARPRLLLCDEPTGNLDSETGREVIDFFRELNQSDGITLLIVTHEERVSSVARRIIQIRDGQLIDDEQKGEQKGGPKDEDKDEDAAVGGAA